MTREEVKALDDAYLLPVYRRQAPLFVRGEGVFLFDDTGKRYLDLLAGIAVNALGHCHPVMVDAISKQAQLLIHTSNGLLTEPQARLAEKLAQITGMERTFFANCGATAMETALKIAKKRANAHGKTEFISLERSFHGRTLGALSATGQSKYQDPFRPLLPGFRHIPANDFLALEEAMGPQTAALLIEPIQGEGGLTVLKEEWIRKARELCDRHGALLVVDEIQTGLGRTGDWLAIHQSGVQPDILVLAKALGGGVPIGACLTRGQASDVLGATEHGTTYGGNALMCAVSLAVLGEIEKLMPDVTTKGDALASLLKDLPGVVEVRGRGLMRGAVLDKPIARDVVRVALERGLVVNATDETTLRFVPPLIVEESHLREGIEILGPVLTELRS